MTAQGNWLSGGYNKTRTGCWLKLEIIIDCIIYKLQYNIKKKEEAPEAETQKEPDNPLMRKKKTPEELAKEAEEADQDELTSQLITKFKNSQFHLYKMKLIFPELKNTLETQVNEWKSQIESKCVIQWRFSNKNSNINLHTHTHTHKKKNGPAPNIFYTFKWWNIHQQIEFHL